MIGREGRIQTKGVSKKPDLNMIRFTAAQKDSRLCIVADDIMRLVREIGLGPEGSSCLVLPAITQVEFTTFHNALFAAENDESLDFFTLIKVAEALGAELVSISFPKFNMRHYPQL